MTTILKEILLSRCQSVHFKVFSVGFMFHAFQFQCPFKRIKFLLSKKRQQSFIISHKLSFISSVGSKSDKMWLDTLLRLKLSTGYILIWSRGSFTKLISLVARIQFHVALGLKSPFCCCLSQLLDALSYSCPMTLSISATENLVLTLLASCLYCYQPEKTLCFYRDYVIRLDPTR